MAFLTLFYNLGILFDLLMKLNRFVLILHQYFREYPQNNEKNKPSN